LFTQRSTYVVLVGTALVFTFVFYTFIKTEPKELLTSTVKSDIHFFGDSIDGGNSKVLQTSLSDSSVALTYVLKQGFSTPYAGFTIHLDSQNCDLSAYNQIKLKVQGQGVDNLYLHINTVDKHVKNTQHRLADRLSAINLSLLNGKYEQPIALEDFETPSWWYHAIGQPESDFSTVNFKKVVKLSIITGIPPILDQPQKLELKSIIFYNDYLWYIYTIVGFYIALICLLFLWQLKSNQTTVQARIVVEYKPISFDAHENEQEINQLIAYINNNYHDSELTLTKVSKALDIQERIISKYINDQYACNFRTYINNIRITEAERLLKNSDLNISEVAYKVGFNDPGFFSKTFKKITGKSPSNI
jgi:AraC-like DNA-binding protein